MNSLRFIPALFGFGLLGLSILFTSCKENSLIRTDVVPAVDNITVFGTDTLTLHTKTVLDDTVVTNAFSSGLPVYVGVGKISFDPFFGSTSSSFYFQVRPPQDNFSIDQTRYQIDSAVLVLPYSGFSFGDTTNSAGTQTFKAYRMKERIYFDSTYYANMSPRAIDANPIASLTVSLPDLVRSYRDSVIVLGRKRPTHLRLRLNADVLNEMVSKLGGPEYANTASFLDFFNGIHIAAENMGNTIPYFRLTGDDIYTRAGILMYYHTNNGGGAVTDTLIASFPFDPTATQTKTGYCSRITKDYNGTPVKALFESTATSENIAAIQSLPGAAMEVIVPHVKNLPRCIVNKAELVISQVASPLDVLFQPPSRIYPLVVDEYGQKSNIADRYPFSSAAALFFIDGNLRVNIVDGILVNQYVLNLPRELQNAIVEQRKELKLRINGTQTFLGANRVTVAGSQYAKPSLRVKLNVVYTKL